MAATDGANLPLQQLTFAANSFWFAQIIDVLNEGKRQNSEATVRILRNGSRNDKPGNASNHA
tara:strand:- start:82 stop:267 length:186 start_codon:yes stop_codon:yes gene_type:complete